MVNVDIATNLPVSIDVYQAMNLDEADGIMVELQVEKAYSIPKDWQMKDLSPTSYQAMAERVRDGETDAVNFDAMSRMGHPETVSGCDSNCRL